MWSLEHSQCRGAPNLAHVTVPSLVIQSTADTGVFPSDAQSIFDGLATDDKMLEWVAGDHYLQDPSDARDAVAGLINDWVEARVS
jgi:esterase/lipase